MRKIDPARQLERRRQILAAAAECFAENGFHATSTAQICARAGMSPGNLFHYYASKAEIIEALIASDTDTLRERRQADPPAADARAALIGWIDENLAQYRDPGFARLGMEILAEAVRNPRVHALVMANENERKASLSALLAAVWRNLPQTAMPRPVSEMADMLLLLLDGIYSRSVVDPQFDAAAGGRLLDAALQGCLPPAPGAAGERP
ncbi:MULTISPECIES: TetR/AcrR family transcriptional regulator [Achromobacter]|uniref:TetR/AcrR family transcriptional regulator n=1 Tax=Achromobacter TaxID=222 RepID=UPI0006C5A72F|nr:MULTISPECIES: TetR/AcrR family transcriptional regulator [Achromobacter]MCH1992225.1 TetR/AcrR family transcriptional regulator [Achromobacter xylosoxidans]OFL33462.1 TetR family transcriptional regulator [Achromobacter xylosoxidans]OFS38511.1 TetR family transcriptional regulator [Achromobacter xylosoxidans]PWY41596.1 TetR/AcrR family transcriptional regulator [Achromobacter sp. RW408]QEQ22542.1 TetR/AcrR family transcriptional regulator [Achromobacter xylosoxidans]